MKPPIKKGFVIITSMKIVSWNVNGLRGINNKGEFLPFIKEYKPDILCLQEIKSQKNQNKLEIEEYQEFWNSAERKGYSGTAIFTKINPISSTKNFPQRIAIKYGLEKDDYGDLNKEGRIITIEFEDFYLVNCYTPNSKPDLSRLNLRYKKWDPAFLEYITDLKKNKNVIFCGDLNVAHTEDDLANPKSNFGKHGFTKEEREGIDEIIKNGFVDTFRMFTKGNGYYTWWSHFVNARARNVGWRIDYFFVNKEFSKKIKSSKILNKVMGSDHCPITIELDI